MGRLRTFIRKCPYIFGKILAEMWQMFVGYLVGLALEMLFLLLVGLAVLVFIVLPVPALIFSLASGGVYAHQRAQQRRRVAKQPICMEPEANVLLRAADRSAGDRATLLRSIATFASVNRDDLLRAGMLDQRADKPIRRRQDTPLKAVLALIGVLLIALGLGTGMGYALSPRPAAPVASPSFYRLPRHAYQGKLIQDVGTQHTTTSRSVLYSVPANGGK